MRFSFAGARGRVGEGDAQPTRSDLTPIDHSLEYPVEHGSQHLPRPAIAQETTDLGDELVL